MKEDNSSDIDVSEESDDSEGQPDQTDRVASARNKRNTNDAEGSCSCACTAKLPPENAKKSTRPKWLPPGYNLHNLRIGNPVFGYRMQLYCRTGFHLAIFPDRKVRGIDADKHPNALVEFSSVNVGEVRIRGVETGLYLAMNKKGRLYGEVDASKGATVFIEYLIGHYNAYLSKHWAHLGWYVGIKKSGKMKPGHQTAWGQRATQFLPRRPT